MKHADVEILLAQAQVRMAFLFAFGFIGLLVLLILYHREMTSIEVNVVTSLLSVFGTVLALQQNFLFARSRPQALPDPGTTTVTSTPPTDGSANLTAAVVQTPAPIPEAKP